MTYYIAFIKKINFYHFLFAKQSSYFRFIEHFNLVKMHHMHFKHSSVKET